MKNILVILFLCFQSLICFTQEFQFDSFYVETNIQDSVLLKILAEIESTVLLNRDSITSYDRNVNWPLMRKELNKKLNFIESGVPIKTNTFRLYFSATKDFHVLAPFAISRCYSLELGSFGNREMESVIQPIYNIDLVSIRKYISETNYQLICTAGTSALLNELSDLQLPNNIRATKIQLTSVHPLEIFGIFGDHQNVDFINKDGFWPLDYKVIPSKNSSNLSYKELNNKLTFSETATTADGSIINHEIENKLDGILFSIESEVIYEGLKSENHTSFAKINLITDFVGFNLISHENHGSIEERFWVNQSDFYEAIKNPRFQEGINFYEIYSLRKRMIQNN